MKHELGLPEDYGIQASDSDQGEALAVQRTECSANMVLTPGVQQKVVLAACHPYRISSS